MSTPFTVEQFFGVFRQYNRAVWPMQLALYALALIAMLLTLRRVRGRGFWVCAILAFLWLWMGAVYHIRFFTAINPAAVAFGALFIVQAVAFFVSGTGRNGLEFHPRADVFGVTGAVFIAYALVVYPALGYALGHRYPGSPTFGLPCPTTIFTFGLLLWAERSVSLRLVLVPALWTLIGSVAAFSFGVAEDYGLLVAGMLGTVLIALRNRRLHLARAHGENAFA
jgi:hypothetical protein